MNARLTDGILRRSVNAIMETPRVYGLSQSLTDPFRIAPIRRVLAQVPHESLLDLGCGVGDLSAMTRASYTGVDISPAYVAHARRRFGAPGRRFEVGDALALEAGLGHHDVVAIVSVLHHMDDDEVRRCLAGLAAVSPRRLLLLETALERTGPVFRLLIVPTDRGRHFRTTAAWRSMLEETGWKIEMEHRYRSLTGLFPYVALVAGAPGS